jgi:hypothetical protein
LVEEVERVGAVRVVGVGEGDHKLVGVLIECGHGVDGAGVGVVEEGAAGLVHAHDFTSLAAQGEELKNAGLL